MDDNLDKFIKSNRTEMDDKNPGKNLWARIEKEIDQNNKQKRLTKTAIFWRTAAVFLLLISSWLVFDKVQHSFKNESELAITNPEFLDAESFYITQINQKRAEVESISKKYNLNEKFSHEIDLLDSMYAVLKNDLKKGNEAYLSDFMILNLQLRIEVLNQQLNILETIKNTEKNERVIL